MKSPLVIFIIKSLGFFIIWYIIYELWLLPDGSLDEFISLNVIGISKGLLESMNFEIFSYSRVIGIFGNPGVEIVDGCNGIAAMGLFLGFILAYPGSWKKRTSFSVVGLGIIYFVNIIRISVLTIIQDMWPAFFDFTHDYSTTTVFYIIIFLMWMIWVNYNSLPSTKVKTSTV